MNKAAQRRMFFRLLRKSMTEQKANVIFALLAMTLGSTLLAALLSITLDIEGKMNRELRGFGANLVLTPRSSVAGASLAEAEAWQAIESIPSERRSGAVPMLFASVAAGDTALVAAGIDFARAWEVFPYWRVEGALPKDNEVLIGSRVATALTLAVGSTLNVGREFRVSGILSTGSNEDNQVFVHLAELQRWTGAGPRISTMAAGVLGGFSAIDEAATRIRASFPAIDAQPLRQVAVSETSTLRRVRILMSTLSVIILLGSALSVTATLTYFVMEQSREIGLLKSLGAENRSVFSLFLLQALAIGVAGGGAGFLIGLGCAEWIGRQMFNAWIAPSALAFGLVVAVAVGVSVIASVPPIRRAVSIEPAVILRGE